MRKRRDEREADPAQLEMLDRHALVMALWLSFGFAAIALLHAGLKVGGWLAMLAGFAMILSAFIGHVIVNAVTGTRFSPREVALGLVAYGAALLAGLVSVLLVPGFQGMPALAFGIGMIGLAAAVLFYMITHFGVRGAFDSFDVIRRFRN